MNFFKNGTFSNIYLKTLNKLGYFSLKLKKKKSKEKNFFIQKSITKISHHKFDRPVILIFMQVQMYYYS